VLIANDNPCEELYLNHRRSDYNARAFACRIPWRFTHSRKYSPAASESIIRQRVHAESPSGTR